MAYQPAGRQTVIPRIIVDDPAGLSHFIQGVFHAAGEVEASRPTELQIGDCWIMVSDGGGIRAAMPAFLYVYVEDVDATYERALAAESESVEAPADQPYGDRRAMVRDPWGNLWQIATHLGA